MFKIFSVMKIFHRYMEELYTKKVGDKFYYDLHVVRKLGFDFF